MQIFAIWIELDHPVSGNNKLIFKIIEMLLDIPFFSNSLLASILIEEVIDFFFDQATYICDQKCECLYCTDRIDQFLCSVNVI